MNARMCAQLVPLLCWTTTVFAQQQEHGNLLSNPGFEQIGAKGSAAGWTWGFYRGKGRIAIVTDPKHAGQRALMMSALPGAAGQCLARKPVPVNPAKRYRVDFWVRSNTGRGQIQIRWQNRDKGQPEQYAINVFKLRPDTWYQLSKLSPKNSNIYHMLAGKNRPTKLRPDRLIFGGAKDVRVYLFTRPNAVVYYDDVLLAPVAEAAAGSALARDALAEYRRLLMDREPAPYPKPNPAKKVVIEQPRFSKTFEPNREFPPHGVTIRDGCFFRNGRHVFFLGAESGPPRPGIMRLLGFKVHCMTGTSTYDNNWTRIEDKGDSIAVSYREWVPLEPKLRDSIRYGFLPIVQTINHAKACRLRRLGRADLVVDQGHFIAYCPDQETSRQMRANFWRSLMTVCRRYPILGYEHFNELGYLCYCQPSRTMFKARMKAKYGSIERANRAWGTQFKSFADADPPYRKGSNTAEHILPQNFSRPMWADWLRFTENHFGDVMARLMDFSRGFDPSMDHYRSIQSHHMIRLDYGGIGVNPILKGRTEGMFGFEAGQTFFPQEAGSENIEEIKASFVGLPLHGAVVRGITTDKPVANLEGGLSRAGKSYTAELMDKTSLLPVQGEWKLKIDPDKRGVRERWFAPEFDDSDWQTTPINDVWDKHGHADYDGWGWYRKSIQVPAALKGKRLWFNGKGFDDAGTLYINGRKIGAAAGWNKTFSFDITDALRYGETNTFAIHIVDNTLYGGLRFFIGVNDFDIMRPDPLTRGMMRMYLWNHVVHGFDVAALSYFYAPEGFRGALFTPYKMTPAVMKAIPQTELEINSLSAIVLPKPRIEGQFAIVYPLETLRAYVPATVKAMINYHATRDFLQYLAPLYCSDVDVDVLHSKHLLDGQAPRYKAIFLRQYERVAPGVLEKLQAYVAAGGTLVVDYNSLRVDDVWHTPIDAAGLTGVKAAGARTDPRRVGKWATEPRKVNGATGARIALAGAQPVLSCDDGSPAVTLNRVGRGRVYFVAVELPYDAVADLLARIIRETGASPEILVRRNDGSRLRFCESHLFGTKGRYVAIVGNYGGGEQRVRIALPQLADGSYRVRNTDTRKPLSAPAGADTWTAAQLRRGLAATLRPLDPLVFVIENAALNPTPLRGLAPKRSAEIDSVWANSDRFHTRVLFEANYPRMDFASTYIYTARRMLNEAGYQWQFALSQYSENRGLIKCFDGRRIREYRLSDFGVLVFPSMHLWSHRWPKEELAAVRQFVAQGGGVLFLGRSFDRSAGWNVLRQFGIRDTNDLIIDKAHDIDGDPYDVTYRDITPHPATRGVRVFQSRGGSHIIPDAQSTVLIRGAASAVTRSGKVTAPVICVVKEFGKGRIAVVGDNRWTDPVFLSQADNAQLWLGLIDWLARRR